MRTDTHSKIKEHEERRHAGYAKVREWLIDYIAQQNLRPGDRLPSERVLGDALGFSRTTIAKGVARLVEEGLLVRKPRSGTFIGGMESRQAEARQENASPVIGVVMPWLSVSSAGHINGEPSSKVRVPFRRRGMSAYVTEGIIDAAKEHDCQLVIRSFVNDLTHYMVAEKLADERVDGWIVMPGFSHEIEFIYARLVENGLPIVFVDQYFASVPADRVVTDNFTAARDAVRYLVQKGHRRIAYLTDYIPASSVIDREAGYRAGLEEAGIPYDEEIVRSHEVMREYAWGFDLALKYFRELPDPVTAIFCVNDDAVLGVLQSAAKWGIAVPDDVELAGFFDDHVPDWAATPFTRVVQDTTGMGRNAVQLLLERLSGQASPEPRHIALPAHLVPNNTSGLAVIGR